MNMAPLLDKHYLNWLIWESKTYIEIIVDL